MCTVALMWLAGIPVADKPSSASPPASAKPSSSTPPNYSKAPTTAKPGSSRSTLPTGRAILRVLEECPEEMLELRATLLQEHVWRQREGLV
jgi:hypothetical protein